MMVSSELKRDLELIKKYKDGEDVDEEDLPAKLLTKIQNVI